MTPSAMGRKTDFHRWAGYPENTSKRPTWPWTLNIPRPRSMQAHITSSHRCSFDNRKFFDYVDKVPGRGITVPIVPGLKPLTRRYQLNSIPRKFFVNMPDELVRAAATRQDEAAIKALGIEWCVAQSKRTEGSRSTMPALLHHGRRGHHPQDHRAGILIPTRRTNSPTCSPNRSSCFGTFAA